MSTYHRISIFMRSHIVSHHHGHELTFTDTLRSPTDRNIFAAREKNDCLYSVVRWCPFTRTSLSLSLSLWIYVFVCLYIFSWCLFSADETNKAKVSFALCSFTVRHTYKKKISASPFTCENVRSKVAKSHRLKTKTCLLFRCACIALNRIVYIVKNNIA